MQASKQTTATKQKMDTWKIVKNECVKLLLNLTGLNC